MISELEQRINEYSAKVLSGAPPAPEGICPRCMKSPEYYKYYDCRIRFYLFIVGNLVRRLQSYLLRWKCPLCGKPFTNYPDFAVPYKRYVAGDVQRLSSTYVERPSETYQGAVLTKEGGLCYDWGKHVSEEIQLNKATIWRWVGWLGSRAEAFRAELETILKKASCHIGLKSYVSIPKRKYRSQKRKRLLEQAWLLLEGNRILQEFFGRSIFPRLATPAAGKYYILSAMVIEMAPAPSTNRV